MIKKKATSFLIVLLAVFCLSFAVEAADEQQKTGAYLVTQSGGAALFETPQTALDNKTVATDGTYLNVIKIENGFGYTVYDAIYGWVELSKLEYVSSYPVTTDKNKIEGAKAIHITSLPLKTTYVQGEDFVSIAGLEVSLIFNDSQSTSMPVTGYKVAFPNLYDLGKKEVTVYYGGFTTTFTIEVIKVPVTGIVATKPTKTTYIEGEPISFDGLTVTAYFSDDRDNGSGVVLSKGDYTVTGVSEGDTSLAPGDYKVTVAYLYPEISTTFHIYVTEKTVVSLKLLKLPNTLVLYQGQVFNNSDFLLSATYDNGETETITNFDIQYDNMLVGENFTARIYYMDKYVAFDYSIRELKEVGIELGDTTRVGNYAGDDVNFSRLEVYVVYNSGEYKLTENYELIHEIDASAIGKYPVTVSYGDFLAEFEYTVAKRNEIRIGDINFDGVVNAADARLALRASAQLEVLSEDALLAADVTLDGKVTAIDARKILRVAAGLDKF